MRLKIFIALKLGFCVVCSSLFGALPADTVLKKFEELYTAGKYYDAARLFQQQVQRLGTDENPQLKTIYYNGLGKAYSQLGKPVEALKYFQQAGKLAHQLKDSAAIGKIEKNIGALYEEQKNFEQALVHYQQSEDIAQKTGDRFLQADLLNNIGIIYEQQLKYEAALNNYRQALAIYKKLNKPDRLALAYNNLGIVYKYQGEYDQAISFYQKSASYAKLINDQFMIAATLNNIGNVYGMKKDFATAINFNKQSLRIAEKIEATAVIVEAISSIAEHYAKAGNYRQAYEWNQKYNRVNANYVNVESAKALAQQQARYQTEQKNLQLKELEQRSKINALHLKAQNLLIQKQQYQILFGALALISATAFMYFFYRRKQAVLKHRHLAQLKEIQSQERSRIAQDVHDDIGSGLSKISLIAASASRKLHANGLENADISNIGQVSKDLVENIRDLIWVLNPKNATLDNLVARIREYCTDYLELCSINACLDIQDDIPPLTISQHAQRNLFLVVKEALHNCVKHAGCNNLKILLRYDDAGLYMQIKDDGKGFNADLVHGGGNGLRNMRTRVETIGGTFFCRSNSGEGCEIIIGVPEEQLSAISANTLKV